MGCLVLIPRRMSRRNRRLKRTMRVLGQVTYVNALKLLKRAADARGRVDLVLYCRI